MAALYQESALVLRQLERKKGSLKSLVFSIKSGNTCISHQKKLYALTSQTLKYKNVIEDVMASCDHFLKDQQKLSHHLCMVLLYDLLLGKGIQCGGPLKRLLTSHKAELLTALKSSTKKHSKAVKSTVWLPRYTRVNSLKADLSQVEEELVRSGYEQVSQTEFTSRLLLSGDSCGGVCRLFCRDSHIPNLLVFCSCAPLTSSNLYVSGKIILQDKASCFPAFLLAPPPGSHVIDACSAPGNKATHLASMMDDSGIIYAFDKDPNRYRTLQKMVNMSGTSCIIPKCQDFLKIDPSCFQDVKYILVDPSCSGSGILNRIEYDQSVDVGRLLSLANFQFKILAHALSFPSVERVVYSTCSVHEQENEHVVGRAVKKFSKNFELVYVCPEWKHRGHKTFPQGDHCIRTSAEDQTNGFFVAVFERMQVATSNSEEVTAATSQFDIREQCCTKIDKTIKTTKTDKATKSKHKKRKRRHFPVTASR